jgi:parvulin-like peptidyl-prolyl isomerase
VIDITPPLIDRLSAQFAATWNRPPTDEELAGLIDGHVREEVLYREALALGLDRDDAVIRQRLRLKMEFISEAAASALIPDDATLSAWYADNAAAFAPARTIGFTQVMLADPAMAEEVRAALVAGADPATQGRGTLLPARVDQGSLLAVEGAFGPGFFDTVAALSQGEWSGPVESSYGWHLVLLDSVSAPEVPPLDSVRDAVIAAWRQEQANTFRESQYQAIRATYVVNLPEAAE